MCRLCDIRDELAELETNMSRSSSKYALALANFADAAKDADQEGMETQRMKCHELLDMMLDHTTRKATLTNEGEAFILQQMRDAPRSS